MTQPGVSTGWSFGGAGLAGVWVCSSYRPIPSRAKAFGVNCGAKKRGRLVELEVKGAGGMTLPFPGIAFVRLFRLDLAVGRMKNAPR